MTDCVFEKFRVGKLTLKGLTRITWECMKEVFHELAGVVIPFWIALGILYVCLYVFIKL